MPTIDDRGLFLFFAMLFLGLLAACVLCWFLDRRK